ncbi:uncharacterized protein LOC124368544 [Homalodisca vitripennis]|uniref:uncharacterized protein LOC124368544 n=1 Tax=Homalodisca vitripennis TaxID=197043 RepID=UPI001EEAFCB6|nr:uncharacterized protein LOC124368544 [Homalodisca vitripennis]
MVAEDIMRPASCLPIFEDPPHRTKVILILAMAHTTLIIVECMVVSSILSAGLGVSAAQFDDQFDPFDDSFYEPGPPYLGDVVKNVPRVGRRNDFFLKAAKSVPRIGRRSDVESASDSTDIFNPTLSKHIPRIGRRNDFFLKAAKSIPRIGRRNDFFLKAAKSVPRIGRRDEENSVLTKRNALTNGVEGGEVAAWPWFRNPDLIPRAFKRSESPVEPEAREVDHGLVVYELNLHKEMEEPRLQAEV